MRKTMTTLAVVAAGLLHATTALAAAWTPPSNVRIVQKDNNQSTPGVYGSLQAALESIDEATTSAANPIVVKVMPGVYDLGTASLRLKRFVHLVGSGPESTVIRSSTFDTNDAATSCTVGAVIMASGSSIRDLGIENVPPLSVAGTRTPTAGLVFAGVDALAERVRVVSGRFDGGGYPVGVCSDGIGAHARLKDVEVEVRNDGSTAAVKVFQGGSVTLSGSRLVADSSGGTIDVVNENNTPEASPGSITVESSTLRAKGSAFYVGIYGGTNTVSIADSRILLDRTDGGGALAFQSSGSFSMKGSIVSGPPSTEYALSGAQARIASSQLAGGSSVVWEAKLVNDYDENLRPIPDQY